MTRLGLLGGTFDPVHVGHLDVAEAARRALSLDRVLLVPANVPPHRALPRASAPHRFAMAALAIAGREGLGLLDIEMLTPEPSYTTATLDRLALRLRSGHADGMELRHLFLITGADAFHDIGTWKDYPAILDRCQFVVVSRPDCPAASLRTTLPALAPRMVDASEVGGRMPNEPRIILVDAQTARVSSTEIRRRLASHESVADMVPALVHEHIATHELYT